MSAKRTFWRGFTVAFAAAFAAGIVLMLRGGDDEDRAHKNVILIVVDTLRGDAVLDPRHQVETPAIDAFATDSTVFPHAFSHAPMTLPAHASLFSSRHPFQTGVFNNGMRVDRDLPLLADWLADSGYETRAIISMGTLRPVSGHGLDRGFDEYDTDFTRMAQAPEVVERLEATLDELEQHGDPFFLFAHFCDPHEPYNAHGAETREATLELNGKRLFTLSTADMDFWDGKVELQPGRNVFDVRADHDFRIRWFECKAPDSTLTWEESARLQAAPWARVAVDVDSDEPVTGTIDIWISESLSRSRVPGRYIREVEFVDTYVGRLLQGLKDRGLYDDSLIVFTSDHGEAFGEHGHVGHVQGLHDEQIRVPLFFKLPTGDPRRADLDARSSNLAVHLDVVPTMLELLEIRALPDQKGRSLLSFDPGSNARTLIAETHTPQAERNLVCLRDLAFKMIYAADEDTFEMFDLVADPRELSDVYAERNRERPDWTERLRGIARTAAAAASGDLDLEPETQARIDALGY